MKQNKITYASIAAIIFVMTAAYWWFTSSQYVDALVGIQNESTTTALQLSDAGIKGTAVQSDKPLLVPLGDSAGPVVDVHTMTVAQVVANLDAGSFLSLFRAEGGNSLIAGNGVYTVFVPTNGAYARAAASISRLSASEKARLVRYHVINGRALDADALLSGSVQTASGDTLNVNLGINSISLVGSAIVVTQYNCKNGVVYTINNVLLPPQR